MYSKWEGMKNESTITGNSRERKREINGDQKNRLSQLVRMESPNTFVAL